MIFNKGSPYYVRNPARAARADLTNVRICQDLLGV
jgi:hypothetical protein